MRWLHSPPQSEIAKNSEEDGNGQAGPKDSPGDAKGIRTPTIPAVEGPSCEGCEEGQRQDEQRVQMKRRCDVAMQQLVEGPKRAATGTKPARYPMERAKGIKLRSRWIEEEKDSQPDNYSKNQQPLPTRTWHNFGRRHWAVHGVTLASQRSGPSLSSTNQTFR